MYSSYFAQEIDFAEQTMISNGEEVRIIPHSELERLIISSAMATDKHIKVHYTQITTNEPRHYVFLCAISDDSGRRVEAIGESLDDTLETQIARNYPTLMAFKRAFDSAAILYLGLEGKVYSDQQCSADEADSSKSFGGEPMNEPAEGETGATAKPPAETPKRTSAKTTAKKPEKADKPTGAKKASSSAQFGGEPLGDEDEGDPAEDEPPEPPAASTKETKPKSSGTKDTAPSAGFGAPPMEEESEDIPAAEEEPSGAFGAPPMEEEEDAPSEDTSDEADEQDIYDKTIITVGRLKNHPMSIRQAYMDKNTRSTVEWVINTMTCYTDKDKELKRLCAEFKAMMDGEEGDSDGN